MGMGAGEINVNGDRGVPVDLIFHVFGAIKYIHGNVAVMCVTLFFFFKSPSYFPSAV